jgi:transcriptional regulator with XRE-family HTH domain
MVVSVLIKRFVKTRHHKQTTAFQRTVTRLAKRLKTMRKARGWTLENSAERFGVEPAHVRRMEKGSTNPSLAVLTSVALAFDLTVSKLLEL